MSGPAWLTAEIAINENKRLVEETGEPFGVLDIEKLEGALARPRNLRLYENVEDIPQLAFRLMIAIAQAHAFEQGNKRTAFAAALIFLGYNGYEFEHPDLEEFAIQLKAVITHDLSEVYFLQEVFEPHCSITSDFEVGGD